MDSLIVLVVAAVIVAPPSASVVALPEAIVAEAVAFPDSKEDVDNVAIVDNVVAVAVD